MHGRSLIPGPTGLFRAAEARHREGRLDEAEHLYRRVLVSDVGHAGAAHNLALILAGRGNRAAAMALLREAVAHSPDQPALHNTLGTLLHGDGKLEQAVLHYRLAVAADPDFAAAGTNLGVALGAMGRVDEATAQLETVIRRVPGHAPARNALGALRQAAGRPEEAILHYRLVLAADPYEAVAMANLGTALLALNRPEEAAEWLERAAAVAPNVAATHYNLGNAHLALGQFEAASDDFARALALKPDHVAARTNLGLAAQAAGRVEEAVGHFQAALALDPDFAAARTDLGAAFQALGRPEEAESCWREALIRHPDDAAAHANLGTVLLELGDLDEAVRALERAADLDPRPSILRQLAAIKTMKADDRHLTILEKLAADPESLDGGERVHLHFALGKALADIGRADEAFRHLLDGNVLVRSVLPYDEAAALAEFEAMEAAFDARRFQGPAQGVASDMPIFVFGMPRSGTTLVEQILASHPRVAGAGEMPFWSEAAARLKPSVAAGLDGEAYRRLGAAWTRAAWNAVAGGGEETRRVVDKMPGNLRFAGLIHLALPGARLIHVRRDPVDTCLSCFATLFSNHHPYAYDLAELGRYWRAQDRLADHWRRVLPSGAMMDVAYEDLVGDFDGTVRRLLDFCRLDWHPACRDFAVTRRPVRTASAAQVRRPLYADSVGKRRPSAEMMAPLMAALAPLTNAKPDPTLSKGGPPAPIGIV